MLVILSKRCFGVTTFVLIFNCLPVSGSLGNQISILRDVDGTTANIEEIFLARCYEYEECIHNSLANTNCPMASNTNCSQLLGLFLKSFQYKRPCETQAGAYDAYLRSITEQVKENQTLLWSGTFEIAHQLASVTRKYKTLADFRLGYLIGGMTWCGQVEDPGINFQKCPSYRGCHHENTFEYFSAASAVLAQQSSGYVTLLLNGSRGEAFQNTSIFALSELPNLRQGIVKGINVVIVHDLGGIVREKCVTGSIKVLEKAIKNYGFQFSCIDDPSEVLYLQCINNPIAKECAFQIAN